MTDDQIQTLRGIVDYLVEQTDIRMSDEDCAALRAALSLAERRCATCQHADTLDTVDGWAFCAPPAREASSRFPFAYKPMPLDEKCKGWTPREA